MKNIKDIKKIRINHFNDLSSLIEKYGDNLDIVSAKNIIFNKTQAKLSENKYELSSIEFSNENVINSLERLDKPAVLIFASAKNPGGGVLRGSIAQEEAISLHTSWYFHAKGNTEFYQEHGDTALNTSQISFATGYLMTNIYHQPISPKEVVFIACAAPNLNGMKNQNIKIDLANIYNELSIRIERVLKTAQKSKAKSLILGAFGCGVFGLDPVKVATIFKEKILENHYTGFINFSIISPELNRIFENIIKHENVFTSIIVENKKPKKIKA